jgi:hypothetical protein
MNSTKEIPLHSRVWVYQASRELTPDEVTQIENKSKLFLNDWTSHGKLMQAWIEVRYNHFVIIIVDEQTATASGCGIDKSVKFIQNLENELNLSLMNRMLVAYREENKINICHLSEFEKLAEQKKVTESTIVFNNLVTTKGELDTKWEVPLKQSWQGRVLVS